MCQIISENKLLFNACIIMIILFLVAIVALLSVQFKVIPPTDPLAFIPIIGEAVSVVCILSLCGKLIINFCLESRK
jgi:hypothetical protein